MADSLKGFPAAPYHFFLYVAVVWRLYYYLPPFSFAVATCALLWLVVRLDHVLKQPVDELVRLLGLEVPTAPVLSLLNISTDSISFYWQVPDAKADTRYTVLINGIVVGDVTPHDTFLSVEGLATGFCYTIRVVAINSQNFQAASDPIRAQTLRSRSLAEPFADAGEPGTPSLAPVLVPYKGSHEALVAPVTLPQTPSEVNLPNASQLEHHERDPGHDKLAQSGFNDARAGYDTDPHQRLHALTSRLNELRHEAEELERQDEEDEAQFRDERKTHTEKRDKLRQELREREEGSKDLKKTIAQLERQNIATQQRKISHEKALESRQQERRKVRDDIQKWNEEICQFHDDIQVMGRQREAVQEECQDKIVTVREEREPDLQAVKQLEEQIRDVGKQVKELDDSKVTASDASSSPMGTKVELSRPEEMRVFNERIEALKRTVQRTWAECSRSQQYLQQLQVRFSTLQSQSRTVPGAFEDSFNTTDVANIQASTVATGKIMNGRHISGPYNGTMPDSTWHGRIPGNAPDSNSDQFLHEPLSQYDIDRLTGGAMVSPSANTLLPSDLLGEEADVPSRRHASKCSHPDSNDIASRPSSTAPNPHSGETPFLPGLGNMPNHGSSSAIGQTNQRSPVQNNSRSPSMNSSPQNSVSGLHQYRTSDPNAECDRRSLRSNSGSIRAHSGRSRLLGDMFSRQRGRTTPDDGPSLGSLKSYQSRSMPRHYDQDAPAANVGSPEQKRASPGGLLDSMSHAVLGRRMMYSSRLAGRGDAGSSLDATSRTGSFVQPDSTVNPWSTTSLGLSHRSRPSSVYSAENMLPRPSSESQPFGWNETGLSRSNTTSSARHRMSPWSAYGSRRGSAQVDPTGSGTISRLDEDEVDIEPDDNAPAQAPIGTKPSRFSMKKSVKPRDTSPTGQLNPNARDFKSMFTRDRKADKASGKSKSKGKAAGDDEATTPIAGDGAFSDKKHSMEYNSQSATESMEDVAGSVGSNTNDSTSTNRESLMKKLTRKSSQLPGLKPKKPTAPSTPVMGADDTDDESSSAAQPILARTPSSITSSPKVSHDKDKDGPGKRSSGFSLSSFKRRSRKEGKDAPSISEASIASETGDDTGSHEKSERASVDD